MFRMILLAILLLVGSQVRADERFLPYIKWLTENSELQYNGEELPTIKYLPYKWLELEVYSPETVAQAERNESELPKIRGAYNDERNEMLLPEDFNWETSEDVIVHELVHFLQHTNGQEPECIQELEPPAYKLHWKWVEDTGYEAEEPNWLFVFLLVMACSDHHYTVDSPPYTAQ